MNLLGRSLDWQEFAWRENESAGICLAGFCVAGKNWQEYALQEFELAGICMARKLSTAFFRGAQIRFYGWV